MRLGVHLDHFVLREYRSILMVFLYSRSTEIGFFDS